MEENIDYAKEMRKSFDVLSMFLYDCFETYYPKDSEIKGHHYIVNDIEIKAIRTLVQFYDSITKGVEIVKNGK